MDAEQVAQPCFAGNLAGEIPVRGPAGAEEHVFNAGAPGVGKEFREALPQPRNPEVRVRIDEAHGSLTL